MNFSQNLHVWNNTVTFDVHNYINFSQKLDDSNFWCV